MKVKGAVQSISLELDKKIMDANYFGPITLTKGILFFLFFLLLPFKAHWQLNVLINTAANSACRIQVKSRRQFPAIGFCDTFSCSIETTFTKFVLFTLQLLLLFTKYTFIYVALSCISLFAAILPNMISRRTGQIVLINSIQGKIGIPFRAACKF